MHGIRNVGEEVHSVDGIEAVSTTYYGHGGKAEDPDVVLLAQHGGVSEALVQRLDGSVRDESRVFADFLSVDRDFGTPELAHFMAASLAQDSGAFNVRVVEALYPRGIVDPNRVAGEDALRKSLLYGADNPLRELFIKLHAKVAAVANSHLAAMRRKRGLFVDLHSMATHTPIDLEREQAGNLRAYLDAYCSRSRRGARRDIDVITEVPGQEMLAFAPLVENIGNRLGAHGVMFKYNDPYPTASFDANRVMSTRYMREYSGVALDFPKDRLSTLHADHSEWSLANLELDPDKIQKLTEILVAGIVETLYDMKR